VTLRPLSLPANAVANPHLFVISGGPGCGKTTLLNELAQLGFPCVPEDAREIICEQVQAGGNALPWADRLAFTRLMLDRSIASYQSHASASQSTFCDRGIPDTLGYARLIGLSDQGLIMEACRRFRYAPLIFLAPPWRAIYTVDDERKQDFAEAEQTYAVVSSVYRELDYQTLELPLLPPTARARFVLENVARIREIK
jgi:predicted ATPase